MDNKPYPKRDGEYYDPKEDEPRYKLQFEMAEAEATNNLRDKGIVWPGMDGYCYSFWPEKKRILKEKYNIDWKTPQELNPDMIWD